MNNKALGIMFRVPEFGKVKKRLAAQIGDEEALKAYTSMLHSTIIKVLNLKGIDIFGFYDGTGEIKIDQINSIPQKGENLGEKMCNTFNHLFDNGYNKAVLIGADSPDLPLHYIEEAFFRLDSYDLVIGPAEDGGYYLIGMSRLLSTIFKDIQWGSSNVMKNTVSIAEKEGIKYFLLPQWYDIDDIENLKRWRSQHFLRSSLP